jgi:DNA recombination protein RmuC
MAALQREVRQLAEDAAALRVERDFERQASRAKLQLLTDVDTRLRDAFQALSAEALESNRAEFLQLAKTQLMDVTLGARVDLEDRRHAIDQLVSPLRASLAGVESAVREIEKERVEAYTELREQVRTLASGQQQLHTETANLARALKSPSGRGRWGEIQLRRVVELAGMLEHCDFVEQETRDPESGTLRPTLVVRLPGGKQVVIDAKVPVSAYLTSAEVTDDGAREAALDDQVRHVRDHMAMLGSTEYWDQFETRPDFVILFFPGEPFFSATLQRAPDLIDYGVDRRVIPSGPITLIALLKAIAYGWRQERIAENAWEIRELGRELHDRVIAFTEHFTTIGRALTHAVEAYNDGAGSLERRVLAQARRFKELGAISPSEELRELPRVGAPQALAKVDSALH